MVHEGAGPLPDGVLRLLDAWLPGRRWYPVPGDGVRHVPWLTVELPAGAPGQSSGGPRPPGVVVPLLHLAGPGLAGDDGALVIQVPLVLHHVEAEPAGSGSAGRGAGRPPPAGTGAPIGVVDTDDGPVAVYDGGTHPAAWRAYLEAALTAGHPLAADPPRADPRDQGWLEDARPLGGEQSNTSVLVPELRVEVPGGDGERVHGVILKILRTVPLGPHPDVVIPEALTRAGWDGVPRYLGSIELPRVPGAVPAGAPAPPASEPRDAHGVHAHLAVVSELVTGADDGFELACAHAQEGLGFDERAAELGAVVARMHTVLAVARPTGTTLDPSAFMGVLRRRAAEAIADVPGLAPYRAGITAFYDEVSEHLARVTEDHPVPLQAIHGDLHLGQVLHARSGWKVLDFEGEPQRPVAERTAPDLPLRDVAGLLRSFDYAAAVGEAADPEWSSRAQLSFLEGYRQALGGPGGRHGSPRDHGGAVPGAAVPGGALDVTTAELLLRALTLDKALYEAVYEARHRPAWLYIPLRAVARVLDR
ncbi:aminoglycoside phosphotransferase [Myceligenerans salitolerans]|uniref:Aminoglycoside phosphotransferase n=1 Tax=Myceligenerans salitolerans TaxID=1230528 RepID=A0ABS3I641_9MICO|nr:aminoglycoside phosphotransferase [Myceligenerans salitolerans]